LHSFFDFLSARRAFSLRCFLLLPKAMLIPSIVVAAALIPSTDGRLILKTFAPFWKLVLYAHNVVMISLQAFDQEQLVI